MWQSVTFVVHNIFLYPHRMPGLAGNRGLYIVGDDPSQCLGQRRDPSDPYAALASTGRPVMSLTIPTALSSACSM